MEEVVGSIPTRSTNPTNNLDRANVRPGARRVRLSPPEYRPKRNVAGQFSVNLKTIVKSCLVADLKISPKQDCLNSARTNHRKAAEASPEFFACLAAFDLERFR